MGSSPVKLCKYHHAYIIYCHEYIIMYNMNITPSSFRTSKGLREVSIAMTTCDKTSRDFTAVYINIYIAYLVKFGYPALTGGSTLCLLGGNFIHMSVWNK